MFMPKDLKIRPFKDEDQGEYFFIIIHIFYEIKLGRISFLKNFRKTYYL